MRIISGKYKGTPLLQPNGLKVRPTGDKVKQALFTKLQFMVQGATVLDLFCGSGSLGIEALSKGAEDIVFVDIDKKSISLTKQNLQKINQSAQVFCCDFKTALKTLNKKFDIILLDPPYKFNLYTECLKLICVNNLLKNTGIIVCESLKQEDIDFPQMLEKTDEKIYGTVKLTFFSLIEKI